MNTDWKNVITRCQNYGFVNYALDLDSIIWTRVYRDIITVTGTANAVTIVINLQLWLLPAASAIFDYFQLKNCLLTALKSLLG